MIELKIYLAVMFILAAGAVRAMIKEFDYIKECDNNAGSKDKAHQELRKD